jgi:MarR family transcriptional regulator for hemolysin
MPLKKSQEPTLPGHLNQGAMLNLLGYHLAQASIPTDSVFKKYINEPFQLNKLEFTILMLIQANENLTPKRLATALNIPGSNLTILLDRLEEKALLLRARSAEDRRVQDVSLSSKGKTLAKKLLKSSELMEDNILKHITIAEKQMLFELLRKISQHRKI